jgi:hypothetical protein
VFNKLNERVKKLTLLDIKLVKLSVFFVTIIIVKFFPQLLKINYPILIILLIACVARPFYSFWIKKK